MIDDVPAHVQWLEWHTRQEQRVGVNAEHVHGVVSHVVFSLDHPENLDIVVNFTWQPGGLNDERSAPCVRSAAVNRSHKFVDSFQQCAVYRLVNPWDASVSVVRHSALPDPAAQDKASKQRGDARALVLRVSPKRPVDRESQMP